MWPYIVDTRRTIDPDFEVSLKEKKRICELYSPLNESNPTTLRRVNSRSGYQANENYEKYKEDDYPYERFRYQSASRPKTAEKQIPEHLFDHRLENNESRGVLKVAESSPYRPKIRRSHSVSEICGSSARKSATYSEIYLNKKHNETSLIKNDNRRHSDYNIEDRCEDIHLENPLVYKR